MATETPKVVDLQSKDFPIDSVTVFTDRAEITKRLDLSRELFDSSGLYDILLQGVPADIMSDSIRVNGTG